MKNLKFKVRASSAGKIMSGKIGLSEIQEARLRELRERDNVKKRESLLIEIDALKADVKQKQEVLKVAKKERMDTSKLEAALIKTNDKIKTTNAELKKYAPLTENMKNELSDLLFKKLNPELPQGPKTFVKNWVKEQLFKRREEIKSKYLEKGNATEEEGFTLMCVELGYGMVFKNEETRFNDFFTGTCDLNLPEKVVDNKSSYSLSTFPMFDEKLDNDDYFAQMQVYMSLYDKEEAEVVYTLNDTPKDLIMKEISWVFNQDEKQKVALNLVFTKKYWEEVKSDFFPQAEDVDFVEIPSGLRVKSFIVKRDDGYINEMKQRVILCQDYVNKLINDL